MACLVPVQLSMHVLAQRHELNIELDLPPVFEFWRRVDHTMIEKGGGYIPDGRVIRDTLSSNALAFFPFLMTYEAGEGRPVADRAPP